MKNTSTFLKLFDLLTLYGCKKSGMPSRLRDVLSSLKNRPMPREQLLEHIQRLIGVANFTTYQKAFQTYLSKKIVVAYEKYGNTIKIDRSQVDHIEYEKVKSLPTDLIDPGDVESQNAVQREKEKLYKKLRWLKKQKSRYTVGSSVRRSYRKGEQEVLEKIHEIEIDPLGYFLRRHPRSVNLKKPLSEEECAAICGRNLSTVDRPAIQDMSTEEQQFDTCMWSCTGKKKHGF